MHARSRCFPLRNFFIFLLLILPAVLTTPSSFLSIDTSSAYSNDFSTSQTSGQIHNVLLIEGDQTLDANSVNSNQAISNASFNPLSSMDYLAYLKQNNFFGTWRSSDRTSKPFQNYFINPTGLMILEVLTDDIEQGGNYFARLPSLKKDIANLHTVIGPTRAYLESVRTWSVLLKLYDGEYVDENSANLFYQIADVNAFVFTPENATLSVADGMIEIFLKDDDGDSLFYKRCFANFSVYFADKSGQPFKDALGDASDLGIQFSLTSPDCNINFTSGILTTNGFEDTFQAQLLVIISSAAALLELYGAYKIKFQIKNRKMAYKIAMGTMWMIATIDYYMLILNLVLIFAFSVLFIVPFFLYMLVTFYFERDIIIRILQATNKRNEPDLTDESCRSCGFYFGLSTILFVFELVFILMSKLWVIHITAFIFLPQIFHNAKRDKPAYFNFYQIFLLGVVRTVFIAYLKYYPSNIFKLSPDLDFLILYSSLMAAQVVILLIQTRFPRLFFLCSKRKRNRVLTEDDVCPICMGDLKTEVPTTADSLLLDFEEIIETPCSHVFHSECLKKWVKNKVECPVCRNKISEVLEEVSSSGEETLPSILQL